MPSQRVSAMTKKLCLVFVVLLALVEIDLCTGRQRLRILVADGASESEQDKIKQGKEALESIDYRVPKYHDIFPKTRNTIYGKTKGSKGAKNPNPPKGTNDQSASGSKKAKKQKLFNPPKVTGPSAKSSKSSKSLKAKSKVGKRPKKQKGSETGSQKNPVVLNTLFPTSDPSSGPTILPVHDSTKLSAVPTSAPGEPLQTTQAPSPTPPDQTPATPLPSTATPVTLAPSTPVLNECSTAVDECCSDSDCGEAQTCANRYCVQQGCPQFTLTWTGRADHDLFVQAPSGVAISSSNRFDSISGGTWEGQDESSLVKIGNYVENIYFPSDCSVTAGIYEFFVLGGTNEEDWIVTLLINGEVQSVASGSGPSQIFKYELVAPTAPLADPAPSECQVPEDECCSDNDCAESSVCAGRNCVLEGNLRFTLTWFGNDNKNLAVQVPDGLQINAANPVDQVSGGTLEKDVIPDEVGFFAENIYFPFDKQIIPGSYFIEVKGTSDSELWTITLTINGEEITSFSSTERSYSLAVNVAVPPEECDKDVDECCSDSDCSESQVCEARNCIIKGSPRFTLSWFGSDDKDIFVTTPDGIDIFYDNPNDPASGGQLQDDTVPDGIIGFYAENIHFPVDGSAPPGLYEYLVRGGGDEPWNVTVALNDEIVQSVDGVGDTSFSYQFGDVVPTASPVPTPSPTVFTPYPTVQCFTPEDECCVSADCASGSFCENRNCILDGFLRFTLTWVGDDDIDLRVRTPDGALIFYQNPFDPVSGGTLEEDVAPEEFGYHVENIFFTEDSAPMGTYQFGVSGEGQPWELSVYLDGELVDVKNGRGLSPDFGFEYGFCQSEQEECCIAQDCAEQGELGNVCTNRNCIIDGFIRFTLIWEGTNDKDLQVTTPDGSIINYESPHDELTGGTLEQDVQPMRFGRYVENIYFPDTGDPLPGTYLYQVIAGGIEIWTVEIYLDGELFSTVSGTQDSSMLTFELPDMEE